MSFSRNPAPHWHDEVPGARWFRADLHVHTLDDHAGGRAKVPSDMACDRVDNPEFLKRYARRFLQAAVAADVQVVALTPHAVKTGAGPETSAVWAIVDCWNTDHDDDGVPFRDKVYAVFPGFEPSFNEGLEGLHLLFMFDPEIGRERYLEAFTLVMGGVQPWRGRDLQLSARSASDAFKELRTFRGREVDATWDYLVVAPHVDADRGLFKSQKKQVLALFEHREISALEIGRGKLPRDIIADKGEMFAKGLATYRHALIHASDAYKLTSNDGAEEFELGHRVTWLKLAAPRVAALRQAFLASDCRVDVAYERSSGAGLVPRSDGPEPVPTTRPWLQKVTVRGGESFFGGHDGNGPRTTEIAFNPGLTCIIGGSMSGKSTLLDGLRLALKAELPSDPAVADAVKRRGAQLGRGGALVEVVPGAPKAPFGPSQWPPRFFAQNELHAAMTHDRIDDLLRGFAGPRASDIERLENEIRAADRELDGLAKRISDLIANRDEAAQKAEEASVASRAIAAFEAAGLQPVRDATRVTKSLQAVVDAAGASLGTIDGVVRDVAGAGLSDEVMALLRTLPGGTETASELGALYQGVVTGLDAVRSQIETWRKSVAKAAETAKLEVGLRRGEMQERLAKAGLSAAALSDAQALTRKAELRDTYAAAATEANDALERAMQGLNTQLEARTQAVTEWRGLVDDVAAKISERFGGEIRVVRHEHQRAQTLEAFLKSLGQKGITQWWNARNNDELPSPQAIADALDSGISDGLGTTDIVFQRLVESVPTPQRMALRALRSPDGFSFQQRLDDGAYRNADELSGGRRVSLLLTLLLALEDARPLIIDQPEDELDNRTLWKTILPALRHLKNRRQIVLVTHNANIVVNGDADLVVQLDADANQGRVVVAGAIEDAVVRKAIVETVDGGQEAFELRRVKYGF